VLILGNSLGYIPEPDADLTILQESWRLLKARGLAAAGRHRRGGRAHENGPPGLARNRRRRGRLPAAGNQQNGRICAREMVLHKSRGMIRDKTYCIRLYDADNLAALAARAGFGDVQVHAGASALSPSLDVGCMNHRLVVVARKP
jgi:hypothetical protein